MWMEEYQAEEGRMSKPRMDKAVAHIMHGSHVTYRSHLENFSATSDWPRPIFCHSSSNASIASISACLVAWTYDGDNIRITLPKITGSNFSDTYKNYSLPQ